MNKIKFLSITIGLIYAWFGILKFFPDISPAESIAKETVNMITFNLIPATVGYGMLATVELIIGIGLIFWSKRQFFVWAAIAHMVCTFVPLFAYPELSFTKPPYGFTILGQYIMKNIIIIAALFVLIPAKKEIPEQRVA